MTNIDIGIASPSTPVNELLNITPVPPASPSMGRHFSAFPLTSHLHTPTIRLVSCHPSLSFTCEFMRVPEIHDGFEMDVYISRYTTVENVVDAVVSELGLSRSLPPVGGGGNFEYVLEEVWRDGGSESMTPNFELIDR